MHSVAFMCASEVNSVGASKEILQLKLLAAGISFSGDPAAVVLVLRIGDRSTISVARMS